MAERMWKRWWMGRRAILLAALGLVAWVAWATSGGQETLDRTERFAAAGSACVVPDGVQEGAAMELARTREAGLRPIPPLDASAPVHTKTASFGLG